jgi:hypothetical protein
MDVIGAESRPVVPDKAFGEGDNRLAVEEAEVGPTRLEHPQL